ncbi:hypothetical protein MOQ_010343 [Trypanosoma cruzi marinkellei]|uniref:Uncharacterized protein n=1 Tax=Trypanosoma cruzi marinkellei TaxID=85056 RepID=K2MFU3_TRYCR|nr:hypothetical protein MOQ_010343 [Trypanosoma cruzi marinkellei]
MRSLHSTVIFPLLVLLLALCLLAVPAVHAEDASEGATFTTGGDADEDDDESLGDSARKFPWTSARVIFPDKPMNLLPALPAGSETNALIAYRNNQLGHQHTVVLIAGYLAPLNLYGQVIQNFSVVRHARIVQPTDTTSFQYTFTPDAMLEPNEYTLILGLYYQDNVTNHTYFATAFNNTVTIDESLETDPKTILLYFNLLLLFGCVAYFSASKLGLVAFLRGKRGGDSSRRRVEVGTNGEGYDPDYVSKEHYRYKEAVLQRHSSSSPTKKRN